VIGIAILFFLLGLLAGLVRSNVALRPARHESLRPGPSRAGT